MMTRILITTTIITTNDNTNNKRLTSLQLLRDALEVLAALHRGEVVLGLEAIQLIII